MWPARSPRSEVASGPVGGSDIVANITAAAVRSGLGGEFVPAVDDLGAGGG